MEEIKTIGIDLAKNTFQVCALSKTNKVVFNKKVNRKDFFRLMETSSIDKNTLICMEACGGAHYIGRELLKLGFVEVKLIAAKFVKPFVKNEKNDKNDALAICEAARRPEMRFVAIKTVEQQNILALHRVREGLVKRRTALSNEIRGLLLEYGFIIPVGVNKVASHLYHILDNEQITPAFKELLSDLYTEFSHIGERLAEYDKKIKNISEDNALCQKIKKLEGVGPVVATAIVGAVGDARAFSNGRQFAAYLGLTPRQFSTGGKTILGRISKRGDPYIRKNLIHGCRSVLNNSALKTDKKSLWIEKKKSSIGNNKTLVALANKNARIIWALLAGDKEYNAL